MVGVQRELPPSLSDTSARSMASQMRSAVEGRVEHSLAQVIVVQQHVMRVLDVDRAVDVKVRGDEEGPEWEELREWVGRRGMVLDAVGLMDGME